MKLSLWMSVIFLMTSFGAVAQTEKENDFSSPPLDENVMEEYTVGKTALEDTPPPNVEAEVKDDLADATDDFAHRIPAPEEPKGQHHLAKASKHVKHAKHTVAKHKHKPSKHTIAHAKSKKHSGHHVVAKKHSNKGRTVASAAKRKHKSLQ